LASYLLYYFLSITVLTPSLLARVFFYVLANVYLISMFIFLILLSNYFIYRTTIYLYCFLLLILYSFLMLIWLSPLAKVKKLIAITRFYFTCLLLLFLFFKTAEKIFQYLLLLYLSLECFSKVLFIILIISFLRPKLFFFEGNFWVLQSVCIVFKFFKVIAVFKDKIFLHF